MAEMTLKEIFQKKHFGPDILWDPNAEEHDKFDYYVTDNPDEIHFHSGATYEDGTEMLHVKAASSFKDGFLSDIPCVRVGKFFVAIVKRFSANQTRWLLKMSNRGWEKIPRKYYTKTVNTEEIEGL